MKGHDSELINEYLIESFENLNQVVEDLTKLEKDPTEKELLHSIYRKIHTLKGSAAFLGFKKQQDFTHILESILDLLREDKVDLTSEIIDVLLKCMDVEEQFLKNIESTGEEGDVSTGIDQLKWLYETLTQKGEIPSEVEAKEDEVVAESKSESELEPEQEAEKNDIEEVLNDSVEEEVIEVKEQNVEASSEMDQRDILESVIEQMNLNQEAIQDAKSDKEPTESQGVVDSTIRVKVDLLDNIMNVVGELVLTRNQILQYSGQKDLSELNNLSQQLNTITTELQTSIMTTRMQPIGSILHKYERVLRDMTRGTGKTIRLELIGQETELDKNLLESIKDPLTHLIRNSVDHGIGTEDERRNVGKSPRAKLVIRSYHEGGQVVIEVKDDGKGLDKDKIIEKAIARGIIQEDQANEISEKQIYNMIFMPSFSTAKEVTEISGRGVGMDVVKTNVEKIGGSVDIESEKGKGTTVKLKIPLTLAIIPSLIVESHNEPFTIPQINLVELVRLEGEEVKTKIEEIQGGEFYRLRGELIPVFRLNDKFELSEVQERAKILRTIGTDHVGEEVENSFIEEEANLVVLNAEGAIYGLLVDSILDTQEIVVKPLSKRLKGLEQFAGATIMGNGEIALIIDSLGFYRQMADGRLDKNIDMSLSDDEEKIDNRVSQSSGELVLFRAADQRLYGIPLEKISRFENFATKRIEVAGNKHIVRYRDLTLPLINIEKSLSLSGASGLESSRDQLNCIVVNVFEHNFGVIVEEILDIAKMTEGINKETADRDGFTGTTYIGERVVTVIDIDFIIRQQKFGMLDAVNTQVEERFSNLSVLILEDSKVFQDQEVSFFEGKGFDVTLVENGKKGLEKLDGQKHFDFIITDIEMPEMDGYEFVTKVREMPDFKTIPIIAITTRVSKKDVDKGLACGIDKYVDKFDADKTLEVINELLRS